MRVKKDYFLSIVILGIFLSSCSNKDKEYDEHPADYLFAEGMRQYEEKQYISAAEAFTEVERQHPYSNKAVEAQFLAAKSYYEARQYEDAIEAYDVFVRLHPAHPNVPEALFMTGLCYYEQIPIIQRDQHVTELALETFQELQRRFPDSSYTRDARFKLDFIYNHLAGQEMDVGRQYLGQKSYLAALERFKLIIKKYQKTTHVPEALYRMVECYLGLGLTQEAIASAAVLQANAPDDPWYENAYEVLEENNLLAWLLKIRTASGC